MTSWMYFVSPVLLTIVAYLLGYSNGKKQGLYLGEKIGLAKRRTIDDAERANAIARI